MAKDKPTVITRADARASGLVHYFTGKPCKRGHLLNRLVSTCSCVGCGNVLSNDWNQRHPERARQKNNEWYARHQKQQRERGRKKRQENIEYYREYSVTYNSKNLPRLAAHARNRRARQRNNGGVHTLFDVEEIFAAQKGRCAYCKEKLHSFHVDHIIALAKGGTNDRRNLQILCGPCNQHKSARDPIEFAQSRGLLL